MNEECHITIEKIKDMLVNTKGMDLCYQWDYDHMKDGYENMLTRITEICMDLDNDKDKIVRILEVITDRNKN